MSYQKFYENINQDNVRKDSAASSIFAVWSMSLNPEQALTIYHSGLLDGIRTTVGIVWLYPSDPTILRDLAMQWITWDFIQCLDHTFSDDPSFQTDVENMELDIETILEHSAGSISWALTQIITDDLWEQTIVHYMLDPLPEMDDLAYMATSIKRWIGSKVFEQNSPHCLLTTMLTAFKTL